MIYVIAERNEDGTLGDRVKIGSIQVGTVASKNDPVTLKRLRDRLSKLQQGNPRELVVVGLADGDQLDEKALHARFDEHRVRRPIKCEWLRWVDDVRAWTNAIAIEVIAISRRSAATPRIKGSSRCSMCNATGHTISRCKQRHVRRDKAGQTFEWRGDARALGGPIAP